MKSVYRNIVDLANLTAPSRRALRELEREWKPELPPSTVAMAEIGRSVAAGLHEIPDRELRVLLASLEELLANGDEETRIAVATGFLEALLAQSSAGRLDFSKIAPFLGKESRKYCIEWDRFTGVSTEGLSN
jgi:hypothetical protein